MTLKDSNVFGNGVGGGGIRHGEPQEVCPSTPCASGTVVLINSNLSENSSGVGGGIASGPTSKMTLTDCTFTDNSGVGIASQALPCEPSNQQSDLLRQRQAHP